MPTTESLPKTDNKEPRLVIVSNRLPVTITKEEDGDYSFKVPTRLICPALLTCKDVLWWTCFGSLGLQEDNVVHLDRMAW